MNTENLQNLIFYRYRYIIGFLTMVFTAVITLVYRLDSLLPGISDSETEQGLQIIQDSTAIIEQGVYLPYNILQTLSIEMLGESALALRLPSIIFGFAILVMMFLLIHMWHKDKIAISSILFLSTSSWFLTIARDGTPQIYMAFSLVLIFLSGSLLRHAKRPRLAMAFSALALPLALYSPYMIYMFALYLFLYRHEIREILIAMKRSNLVILMVAGFAVIAPLLYGILGNSDNMKLWLGIEAGIPSISEFFENVLAAMQHILWSSQINPELHLGNLAMLDIFTCDNGRAWALSL